MSSGRPSAGALPSCTRTRLVSAYTFASTRSPGRKSESPASWTPTRRGHLPNDELDVLVVDRTRPGRGTPSGLPARDIAASRGHRGSRAAPWDREGSCRRRRWRRRVVSPDRLPPRGVGSSGWCGTSSVPSSPTIVITRPLPSSSAIRTTPAVRASVALPLGRPSFEELDDARQTAGDVRYRRYLRCGNVRMVSCVPGSPIDCAAMTPTASPSSIVLPVASERP